MPRSGFLFLIAKSLSTSTKPLMLFRELTQLLNEPCPGKINLSLDFILFKSEVTSRFTLLFETSLKEFIKIL